MQMEKNELDPLREAIEQGFMINVYVDDHRYERVLPLAATSAYIAFEPEDDQQTFTVIPWHRVNSVTYAK